MGVKGSRRKFLRKKYFRWIGWAVVWIAAIFFLQNGIQKLIGTDLMVTMFDELGLPDWLRILVGCIEALGAIILVVPRYTSFAAAGLFVLMFGAVVIEGVNGRYFSVMISGQWLILFAIIILVRYRVQFRKGSDKY